MVKDILKYVTMNSQNYLNLEAQKFLTEIKFLQQSKKKVLTHSQNHKR